ncbi:MAG: DUF2071 domain-containing protein [Hymenobacteraceae bacterium]|nr:DUF2071 domain-containing protein [Hymenobacteraceae bacterium]
MNIPTIKGLIRRRLLVNFRADPVVVQRLLPTPFQPKQHDGVALVGICLIRLEQIRPDGLPGFMGISSENAAHRIAVEWTDETGAAREGVFIPRRDTGSRLNHAVGGRIFPGEHHLARFDVMDASGHISLVMQSADGQAMVRVVGREASELPVASCFRSLSEASRFFEGGSLGYSVTRDPQRLDGLQLHTAGWHVRPLTVEVVESSFFENQTLFPLGTIEFDHALLMRDVAHEWRQVAEMRVGLPG